MYQVDGFVGPSTAFLPLLCFSLKMGCSPQLNDEVLIFYLYMHFFPPFLLTKLYKSRSLNTSTQLAKLHAPSVGTAIIP